MMILYNESLGTKPFCGKVKPITWSHEGSRDIQVGVSLVAKLKWHVLDEVSLIVM
jgi:hypothetical protein